MIYLIVKSSTILPVAEITETKNKVSTITLRRNFEPRTIVDSLTSEESTEYEYEEVKVYVNHRPNLLPFIQVDFDKWFNKGLKLEQLNQQIQDKKREMDKLIKEFEQVKVNSELKEEIMTSYGAVADLYMDNLILTMEKDELKKENVLLMEAVADLYVMIMGGE